MGINPYTKDGKVFYRVRVSLRSEDQTHRVQRERSGISSLEKAKIVEKRLIREVQSELISKSSQGPTFGSLVENWELAQREIDPKIRGLQVLTIIDHVNCLRMYLDHLWDVPADYIKRADIKDVLEEMRLRNKSKSRLKAVKAGINIVYKWAIEDGRITSTISPAHGFKIKHKENQKT